MDIDKKQYIFVFGQHEGDLSLREIVTYSALVYRLRVGDGTTTVKSLSELTTFAESKALPSILQSLEKRNLAERFNGRWRALEPPANLFYIDAKKAKYKKWYESFAGYKMLAREKHSPLTMFDNAIYWKLISRAKLEHNSYLWQCRTGLAKLVGVSLRTVHYSIKRLAAENLLKVFGQNIKVYYPKANQICYWQDLPTYDSGKVEPLGEYDAEPVEPKRLIYEPNVAEPMHVEPSKQRTAFDEFKRKMQTDQEFAEQVEKQMRS